MCKVNIEIAGAHKTHVYNTPLVNIYEIYTRMWNIEKQKRDFLRWKKNPERSNKI